MKKENVIDLNMYRNRQDAEQAKANTPVSKELEKAIEMLIQRLKETGPIPTSS